MKTAYIARITDKGVFCHTEPKPSEKHLWNILNTGNSN